MPSHYVELVERFYHDAWNQADEDAAHNILHDDLVFRGSLGDEKHGPNGVIAYMRSIHKALGNYQCIIEEIVADGERVAVKMTFTGMHQDDFMGVAATGREISWSGAAFFTFAEDKIVDIWVLGDVDAIRRQLGAT